MKIVVLAGGTSTERSVSITSGTMVCKALREKNHQAVLVDIFCGIEVNGNLEDAFAEENYDVDKAAEYMHSFDEKLDEIWAIAATEAMIAIRITARTAITMMLFFSAPLFFFSLSLFF